MRCVDISETEERSKSNESFMWFTLFITFGRPCCVCVRMHGCLSEGIEYKMRFDKNGAYDVGSKGRLYLPGFVMYLVSEISRKSWKLRCGFLRCSS